MDKVVKGKVCSSHVNDLPVFEAEKRQQKKEEEREELMEDEDFEEEDFVGIDEEEEEKVPESWDEALVLPLQLSFFIAT